MESVVSAIVSLIYLAVGVLMLAGMWKIFVKLGEDGWKAIIPIYNLIVLLPILKWELWKIVLLFIPIVNIVFSFFLNRDLAARFGKSTGFAVGMFILPFIFYPMLGFKEENQPIQE